MLNKCKTMKEKHKKELNSLIKFINNNVDRNKSILIKKTINLIENLAYEIRIQEKGG